MAKQLLIMRHAQSFRADSGDTDFQRRLDSTGLHEAAQMGRLVAAHGSQPDLIASSPAIRAKMTAEAFVENCDGVPSTRLNLVDDFYNAQAKIYLRFLAGIESDETNTIMLIGHNPGIERLIFQLSDEREGMTTAAIAQMHLEIYCWSELIMPVEATLKTVWRPTELDLV